MKNSVMAIALCRKICTIIAVLLLTTTYIKAVQAESKTEMPHSLQAGAAKIDISPDKQLLGGGKYIRDPLFARVLFIQSKNECAVLVEVDKALVFNSLVKGIRETLSDCKPENVFVWATHTHSANDLPFNPKGPEQAEIDLLVSKVSHAVTQAKRNLVPARMGFGTTDLHLNTNRDVFNGRYWYQGTNKAGVSDKSLAVIYFLNEQGLPIGLVMNYGMHPISYFLSDAISADFPGEASAYIEDVYPGAVALYSQAASGDQNPLLSRPLGKLIGMHSQSTPLEPSDKITDQDFWSRFAIEARQNVLQEETKDRPSPPSFSKEQKDAVIEEVGKLTAAMGAILGETAIEVMRSNAGSLTKNATLFSASEVISCPGRDRTDYSIREGFDPGYVDGDDVKINVSLLKIGELALIGLDSEVYTDIVLNVKAASPLNKTAVIGLANGLANSGYIYSDQAAHSLVFQVVGSRLKPGCAEHKIVESAVSLIQTSMQE